MVHLTGAHVLQPRSVSRRFGAVQALVKTIARVRPVDAGTITWHGEPVRPARGGARESAACGGSG
jgi:D-xylose transport system ATP-binding protein